MDRGGNGRLLVRHRSPIVQLAEALSDGGLDVDAVVSTNRVVPSRHDFGEGHWIDSSLGEALRLELEWGIAAVFLKPTLGWVMDVDSGLAIWRMDLGRSLTGLPSAAPCLVADQIETVAAVVRRVVEEGPSEPTDGRPPVEVLWDERPEIHAAAWWMRQIGYARTDAVGGELPDQPLGGDPRGVLEPDALTHPIAAVAPVVELGVGVLLLHHRPLRLPWETTCGSMNTG